MQNRVDVVRDATGRLDSLPRSVIEAGFPPAAPMAELLSNEMTQSRANLAKKSLAAKRSRRLVLLAVALLVMLYQLSGLTGRFAGFMDDFIAYWAAGRLQLSGQSPYSYPLISEVQRATGSTERHVMLYPPWAFSLLMLLGIPDYGSARFVWLLLNLGLLVLVANMLWALYGGPPHLKGLAWLIAFLFYPSLYLLRIGQMSLLVLLGLVVFLRYQREQRDWLAGMALFLAALKPHLAYLFWIALALWVRRSKRWRLLASIAATFLVTTTIPLVVNPDLLAQSSEVWGNAQSPFFHYDTPTLGTILRKLLPANERWLQLAPMALGSVGLLIHWRKARHAWNWEQQVAVLLPVSSWTTLYCWTSDMVLLLPVVFQASVTASSLPTAQKCTWFGFLAGLNAFCFLINVLGARDFAYCWLTPVTLFGWWSLNRVAVGTGKRAGTSL